tara:strand:- start:5013 stop:6728 length:1716 start_codon:yes stop_codon:yes gene_type:complete
LTDIFIQITKFLNKENKKFTLVLFSTFLTVIFESFGFISLVPLISVLINPDLIHQTEIIKKIYYIIDADNDRDFIISYGVISISIFIFSSFLFFINNAIQVTFVNKIVKKTRLNLLDSYLEKDYSFHKETNSVHLISKMFSQIDETSQLSIYGYFDFLNRISSSIIFIILLAIFNFKISILALVVLLVIYFIIDFFIKKKIHIISEDLYSSNLKSLSYAVETIKSFKEIISTYHKKFFMDRYSEEIHKIYKARNFVRIMPRASRFLIESLAIGSSIIVVLSIFITQNNVSAYLNNLVFFVLAMYKILPNLNTAFMTIINLKSGFTQFTNIISDLKPENLEDKIDNNKIIFNKLIELKNINFNYGDKKILQNINCELKKNETIVIFGKSGSGKTTLCEIICGFLSPSSGKICIDNSDISLKNKPRLRKLFGYVGQDTIIINEDFYTNISFSKKYNVEKVKRVSELARIHEFINTKENTYKYQISENGKNLSGGQKQRVAIARALYNDPEIIILDEATNNLDKKTEQEFYELVDSQLQNVTKIIITHNLNSIKKYDKLYLIQDNCLIESKQDS